MNNNTSTTCPQNAVIVRELLKFCRAARSSGDSRLGMTYSKAINSIRAHPQPILNGQQAIQLNGVGNFIAGKIDEILDFERTFQADFANQPSIQQTSPPNQIQQQIFQATSNVNDRGAIPALNNSGNGIATFITSYPQSVADWLRELDFLCYLDGFLEAGYDNLLVCEQLNETDLEHIKIITKPGHRKTILVASQELHQRRKNREMNGLPAIPVPRNSNLPPAPQSTSPHQIHTQASGNSASPPNSSSPHQRSDVSSLPIPKVVRTRNGGLIPKVTEDFVRSNSTDASFERGKQLFQSQSVISLIIDGEHLKAEVQGSTPHDPTYKVLLEVNLQREKVASATCTCPYDQEAWCKHIVATLCALQNSSEDSNNSQTSSSSQPDAPRDTSPTFLRRSNSTGLSNYNDYFASTPLTSNSSSTNTSNANVTKKPRKNPPKKTSTNNDATQTCNINNTTNNDNNTNTNSKPADKTKANKRYIPTFRSGGWALLLALYEASLADDYPGYLLKSTLIEKASPLSDHSFETADNGWYSAWNSMKTLKTKGLVLKQKSPAQYSLSAEGFEMAKELYAKKNVPQKSIDVRQLSPKKNLSPQPSVVPSDSAVVDAISESTDASTIVAMDIREPRVPLSPRNAPQMDSDEEPLILHKRNTNNANIANNTANTNKKRPLPDSNKENQNPVNVVPNFRDNNMASLSSDNFIDLNEDRDNTGNSQYKVEVVLILDNREIKKDDNRNLFKGLCHHGINCEKRNLELGDVLWIVKRTLGSFCEEVVLNYILERKKISDLFASLEDGRYTEQKFRLKKSGLKNPIYLIEGNSGVLERADIVENALCQTQLEGFFVQRTANEEETLHYLLQITRQLEDFYKRKRERQLGLSNSLSYGRLTTPETCFTFQDFSNQVSKSKNLTLTDLFAKQLLQLPHCTPEKVSEIVKLHGTPRLLLEAYKKEPQEQDRTDMLKNLEYGQSKKRKIGALSKVIADFYIGDYVFNGI